MEDTGKIIEMANLKEKGQAKTNFIPRMLEVIVFSSENCFVEHDL